MALEILGVVAAAMLMVACLRGWVSAGAEDLGQVTPTWRAPLERPIVDPVTLERIQDRWARADHRAAKSRIRRVS